MAKKHKKAQVRKRTKATVGKREFQDVVYLEKEMDENGVVQIVGMCTCDKWHSSKEATTITKVALEAKKHVESGPCTFRPHAVDPEDEDLAEETDIEVDPTTKE